MSTTATTYMNLPAPNVGSENGPQYATDINTCLTILDQHNHTAGSGQQIPVDGISIAGDLVFNDNNAISLKSTRFTAQSSPLAGPSDLGCLYVSGVDLYYNDGSGNQVQITASGTVNATSSGISSGTASAAFSAGVLVVKGSSTTGASVQMLSAVLTNSGNLTNKLTLQAPTLSGSLTQTLPATPGSTGIMRMDSSGNMSASLTPDNSTLEIATNTLQIKASGVGTTQLADSSVTPAKRAALGQQVSSSSGNYSNNSGGTWTTITNQTITITTTGRPVMLMVIPDGSTGGISGNLSCVGASNTGNYNALSILGWNRDGTIIAQSSFQLSPVGGPDTVLVAPGCLNMIDTPSAGTHTYTLQGQSSTSTGTCFVRCGYCKIIAYEL